MTAITALRVAKRFGDVAALRDVTLTVPTGSIYGFLGPNGAGKTTFLRGLIGLLRFDAGEARVLDLDPWHDRVRLHQSVGYLPSGMGMYARMRGTDVLDTAASLTAGDGRRSPLRRTVLDALQLSVRDLERPVSQYSKGMRQKVAITQAMQHDPHLLLMDEPSDGLDPLVQHALADLLRDRARAGRTVLFSSHTLSEVDSLCDHVAFIREGAVVAPSATEELQGRSARHVRIAVDDPADLDVLSAHLERLDDDHAGRATFRSELAAPDLVALLAQVRMHDLLVEEPTLDDLFRAYYAGDDR